MFHVHRLRPFETSNYSYVIHGYEPKSALDLLLPDVDDENNTPNPPAEKYLSNLQTVTKLVQDLSQDAQLFQEKYSNDHRLDVEYNVGDKVLIDSSVLSPFLQIVMLQSKFQLIHS